MELNLRGYEGEKKCYLERLHRAHIFKISSFEIDPEMELALRGLRGGKVLFPGRLKESS